MTVKTDLDAYLQSFLDRKKNLHKSEEPAFRAAIGKTTAPTAQEMAAAAQKQAVLDHVVLVMSAPMDPQAPRYAADAVRTKTFIDGVRVSFKVMGVESAPTSGKGVPLGEARTRVDDLGRRSHGPTVLEIGFLVACVPSPNALNQRSLLNGKFAFHGRWPARN